MEVGMMRKETRLKKTINNAVENTIKRFSKLKTVTFTDEKKKR
tara:strand:+ start:83 stop:211 length:129 start_codon:yes stop_codon:yes gene_type:complete